ncbi:MAG: MarR family transcriptional regulator [bacterium]
MLHKLKRINDYVERYGNNTLKEHDLTLAQCHVLGHLLNSEKQECTLKELEKSMNVAQSTSAGVVMRLEKKGFVITYTDPNDKRVKKVKLSDNAEELLEVIRISMGSVEDRVLKSLTNIEKLTLKMLVDKIADNLE